ncbi:Nitrate/nitrite transporter [hydrothermal vent metagenome]|uniref:Nitrate/nitrite transporter n=1 Tax=hydrothermal vent metagenome TaxID=652676 RepID=A0A1W1BXC7_9ZZZZ
MLTPLKDIRVWRLGMYYFIVFGLFVAFSQWLVPYFVNVYALPLVTAGLFAAAFSFPSGVIRAFGGYLSDKFGGNRVTLSVFLTAITISAMLMIPKMTIESPGKGIMSKLPGEVTAITENTVVVTNPKAGPRTYKFVPQVGDFDKNTNDFFMLPTKKVTQVPVVKVGDKIGKKQLLVKGTTNIFFQANVWIFGILAVIVGAIWGIGKASIYKLVAEGYPQEVGVVGGIVGVLGGMGGFVSPIIFGWLLGLTGLWSSAWMFVLVVTLFALFLLVKAMNKPGAAK